MSMEIIAIVVSIVGAAASIWYLLERALPLRRLPWRRAEKAASRITARMRTEAFDPTLIVGMGRGGAIMGALISGCLGHRPLLVVDRKYTWVEGRRTDDLFFHVHLPPSLIERVLLVAGEAHSGNTMRLYHDYFRRIGAREVKRAAFYLQKGCTEPIEFVGEVFSRDLRMPWMFAREYARDSRSEEEARSVGHIVLRTAASARTYFLVRHGRSADNEQGDRYSGITDSPLTEVGLEQARRAAHALQQAGIQCIVTSPMNRAVATARAIHELTAAPLIIDSRLREMDFGEWEGMTRKEVHAKWPELYERYKADPAAHGAPGGESPQSVLTRVVDLLRDLEAAPSYRDLATIVLVTHHTIARIMLTHLSGQPLHKYRERRIDNASISKVVADVTGGHVIVSENDTSHLHDIGAS